MSVFVVLVVLAIPSRPGLADIEQVVHREWITASSVVVCQQHADKRAVEARTKYAADIARLKARTVGICTEPKELT